MVSFPDRSAVGRLPHSRDLSERIEKAIIRRCESFSKGHAQCDTRRSDQDWEVKLCKDSGGSGSIRGAAFEIATFVVRRRDVHYCRSNGIARNSR
jgi:hypothetical protein